jgi:hypothetical protein
MTFPKSNTPDIPLAEIPVLRMNDKNYPVDSLPQDVKYLLGIYASWESELKTAKVEVFKLEAAIKGISSEIELRIQQFESTPQA